MAVTGTTIKNAVRRELIAPDAAEYTDDDLLYYINDAQFAVTLLRPDAKAQIAYAKVRRGVTQSLTPASMYEDGIGADALVRPVRRLQSISHNVMTGTTISGPIARADMDAFNQTLHADTSLAEEADNFAYNKENPLTYYLYPGISAAGVDRFIQVEVSVVPLALAALTSPLDIDDVYQPAIMEWAIFRAWSRDSERSPTGRRAMTRFRNFFSLMGVSIQADSFINPQQLDTHALLLASLQGSDRQVAP